MRPEAEFAKKASKQKALKAQDMRTFHPSLWAAVILGLLCACGSPSTGGTQGSTASPVVPDGVAQFKSQGDAVRAGIYPSSTTAGCCFLAPRANITLTKPAGKLGVTLHFYVPKVQPYASGERVTVNAGGTSVSATNGGTRWITITLALPSQYRAATAVPVEITSSKSFIPSKLGMNNDTRELSVVLSKVEFP